MGLNGKGRSRDQLGCKAAVNLGDNSTNSRCAAGERIEHRFFPPVSVEQVSFHRALGIVEAIAVPGQEDVVVAIQQNFERRDVVGHAPFGRRDDCRIPRHYVIAGENDPAAFECEAEMIRRVSRRVNRRQRPVGTLDRVTGLERNIRCEVIIDEIFA